MRKLHNTEVVEVNGAGWDSFWHSVGSAIGNYVASSSYSRHSKSLHDIGTGKSDKTLDEFLSNQYDALL